MLRARQKKRKKSRNRLSSLTVLCWCLILPLCFVNSAQNTSFLEIKDAPDLEIKAISDVISKFYIANSIKFDFIIYGESSSKINNIIEDITKYISKDSPVTIKKISQINSWNHRFTQSAVIFIKSLEKLKKLQKIIQRRKVILTNLSPKMFKFFVYIEEINSFEQLNDIMSAFNKINEKSVQDIEAYEFFITSDDKSVNLSANLLYSENKCEIFTLKVFNSFDKKSYQWSKEFKNFNHFDNLHGCLLKFQFEYCSAFYINQPKKIELNIPLVISSDNFEYGGMIHEIMLVMSKKHNFSFHYTPRDLESNKIKPISRNFVPNEYTFLFMVGMLSFNNYHYTEPFTDLEVFFLITQNDFYTNYEKLNFIFDSTTWLLLLITLCFTFGTIFSLYFCPSWMRIKVFGRSKTSCA